MKPVLIPTERGVSMAFSRRPSWPLISYKFHSFTNKQVAVHPSILFLIAMDYVIIYSCHSQIAFPTVLMFFLVTQFHVSVRNCEDESRILNDHH
ncbi:hypothetical protein T02_16472, partial [Trichinella nativa]